MCDGVCWAVVTVAIMDSQHPKPKSFPPLAVTCQDTAKRTQLTKCLDLNNAMIGK